MFDSIEKVRILENQFGKIDILFTQFGYANKIGRRNEPQKRLKESEEKLNRIKLQYEYLRPNYIIRRILAIRSFEDIKRYIKGGTALIKGFL